MALTNEQLKQLFASDLSDDQLLEAARTDVPAFQGLDDATARQQLEAWRAKARAGTTTKAAQAPPETTNIIDALRSGYNRSAAAAVGEPIANILSMLGAKGPAAEYKQASKNLASGPVPKGVAANAAYLATRVPGLALQFGLPFMFPGYGGAAAGGAYIGAQGSDDPTSVLGGALMGLGGRFGLNKFLARRAAAAAARTAASETAANIPSVSVEATTSEAPTFTRLIPGAQPISTTGIPSVTTETLPRTVQTAKGLIKPPTWIPKEVPTSAIPKPAAAPDITTPGPAKQITRLLNTVGMTFEDFRKLPLEQQLAVLNPLMETLRTMAGTIK